MANRGRTQLRAPYDTSDDYPPPQPQRQTFRQPEYSNSRFGSPRVADNQLVRASPSRGPSRLDLLEERLSQQEKNTQGLVERAFRTKEDVIESLNFTHGTWQEEKHARNMLQEHIRTITAVVNRLNNDIAALEENIRARDNATVGTNTAVKNLEVHHVATLTDLRGRIVRCDTSISKLSTDLRGCFDSIKQVTQQQQDSQNRVMDRLHQLESRLVSISSQIERNSSEQKIKMQHIEGDTGQQMAQLDSRTRQIIDDLKNNITTYQSHADVEREKLEGKLQTALESHAQIRDSFIEKLERKIDESQYVVDAKLHKLEENIIAEGQRLTDMQQHLESKVISKLDGALRAQHDEINKLKRDTRDGFSTVHESISNMKTVMEGKRKLLEDQLRKEISQIRKMVVLV